ncbi:peptidoglycan-binding protein [Blautia sp. MSJ-19]|uniref:peptidoglycan-binding protein n=1 Tax=Blautia sp. MSJ-19 TaxID=2841517 RepID=UPI001C0EFAA3
MYAEDVLQYGQEAEIQTDSGSYKVTVDKIVETDQFDRDDRTAKVICVDCVIENIDYKNYDNQLSAYNVGTGEVALVDADGISAEFYDVSTTSKDGYEFSADIKPGEKKRVALPFFVPEDTESVTVKIDSKYEISQNLHEEGNETSTDETQENDVSELQKQIETLEAENNDLKAENEELKKENEELKNSEKNQEETPTPEPTEVPAEDTSTPEPTEEAAPEETAPEAEQKPVVEYKDATTIRIVQQALNDAGYNCGNPDGVAGGKTTEAVTKYQTDKGLTVNGLVTDELLQSLDVVEKVQDAVQKEASKGEYAGDYTYDQLARNPDTYTGNKIKISGKVLQADSSGDICYARVAMNNSYDTVIFVTYDKDLLSYRLLEDDKITVYGTSLGVYSYEAVSGATITIPWLNADMIEM